MQVGSTLLGSLVMADKKIKYEVDIGARKESGMLNMVLSEIYTCHFHAPLAPTQ
jgi:hypothetical protein